MNVKNEVRRIWNKNLKSAILYPVNVSRLSIFLYIMEGDEKDNSIKQCSNCGKLIKIKGKNSRYCDKCAKEKELESKRNWWSENNK